MGRIPILCKKHLCDERLAITLRQPKRTMAIELKEERGGKLLEVHVSGKLTTADYEQFIPSVERLIQQNGKIDILFEMFDFHG